MPSSGATATARCWACGAAEVGAWRLATPADEGSARADYVLERCGVCGTAVVAAAQRLGETPKLYETGTYGGAPRRLGPLVTALRALVLRDRMRFLHGLPSGARVLEVGCGDGRFLSALAARGYAARGIERVEQRAALTRGRGLCVENVAVEEAQVPDDSQDVVVLWHVLEHLDDPGSALTRVRRWLAPQGRLVVAAPNLASLQARLGGDCWFHQDVPRHLTHFTAAGLVTLIERSGFRVKRVRHVLVEHNVFGMWQTLLNRLTLRRNAVYGFVKHTTGYRTRAAAVWDAGVVIFAGGVLVVPAIVLELTAALVGRGGTVVVEASRS